MPARKPVNNFLSKSPPILEEAVGGSQRVLTIPEGANNEITQAQPEARQLTQGHKFLLKIENSESVEKIIFDPTVKPQKQLFLEDEKSSNYSTFQAIRSFFNNTKITQIYVTNDANQIFSIDDYSHIDEKARSKALSSEYIIKAFIFQLEDINPTLKELNDNDQKGLKEIISQNQDLRDIIKNIFKVTENNLQKLLKNPNFIEDLESVVKGGLELREIYKDKTDSEAKDIKNLMSAITKTASAKDTTASKNIEKLAKCTEILINHHGATNDNGSPILQRAKEVANRCVSDDDEKTNLTADFTFKNTGQGSLLVNSKSALMVLSVLENVPAENNKIKPTPSEPENTYAGGLKLAKKNLPTLGEVLDGIQIEEESGVTKPKSLPPNTTFDDLFGTQKNVTEPTKVEQWFAPPEYRHNFLFKGPDELIFDTKVDPTKQPFYDFLEKKPSCLSFESFRSAENKEVLASDKQEKQLSEALKMQYIIKANILQLPDNSSLIKELRDYKTAIKHIKEHINQNPDDQKLIQQLQEYESRITPKFNVNGELSKIINSDKVKLNNPKDLRLVFMEGLELRELHKNKDNPESKNIQNLMTTIYKIASKNDKESRREIDKLVKCTYILKHHDNKDSEIYKFAQKVAKGYDKYSEKKEQIPGASDVGLVGVETEIVAIKNGGVSQI